MCVDKCDVEEGFFSVILDCKCIFPGCHCHKLLVRYVVCGFVIVNDLVFV